MTKRNAITLLTGAMEYIQKSITDTEEIVSLYVGVREDGTGILLGDATNAEVVRMIYIICRSATARFELCPCDNCNDAMTILEAFKLTILQTFVETTPERMN
jgi:hypothetical protein